MSSLPDYATERARFEQLIGSLLDTYRPEGVLIWLSSSNRNLNHRTPRELMATGSGDDWAQLLNEADRIAGGW